MRTKAAPVPSSSGESSREPSLQSEAAEGELQGEAEPACQCQCETCRGRAALNHRLHFLDARARMSPAFFTKRRRGPAHCGHFQPGLSSSNAGDVPGS